jgi:hypothetical protein
MDDENEDMSEENDIKNKLDKDDEDIIEPSDEKKPDEKIKKENIISPFSSPIISHKTPPKSFSYMDPIIKLFSKHDRSSSESDSSESYEQPKKRKLRDLSEFQKSFIKSQKENFDKNYNILKDDFRFLEQYETKIFKDTNLDIMFIMDLTGSMGIWLNEAKKNIKKIIEEIYDNNPGSKIRISFIGYRDFIDEKEVRKYDNIEFTENLEEFNNFLSKLDCSGGGDEPEDVVGALQQGLNMKWESNAKYAVLVADAPCHGKNYHNITYDKFPNGDPSGVKLEDVMKQFYEKNITFYCIEINNNTRTMFNIMKNMYNDKEKFHVEKLGNSVDQFSFFVTFSASVLLGNEKYRKVKFSEILKNYRDETINKIMEKYLKQNINNNSTNIDSAMTSQLISQIENLNLGGEDKKLFDFINRMSDLSLSGENNSNNFNLNEKTKNDNNNNDYIKVDLNEENIKKMESKIVNYNLHSLYYEKNSGRINDWVNPTFLEKNFKTKLQLSFSSFKKNLNKKIYEFHFIDNILNKEKTGKIPFLINKSEYNNPSEYIKKVAYEDLICEQMADYFNILINEKLPNLKQFIKFQRHILYEIDLDNSTLLDDFFLNNKYIISEDSTSIQLNTSVPPTKRVLQNFSHFSYQISGGQLFVTDINYDKELKKVTEYKIYNLKGEGYKKILEFFSNHICDNTCKILKLANPRKKLNPINVNENFFMDRYTLDIYLCECCSCPIQPKEESEENKNCGFCTWKKAQSKINVVCSKCKFPFFYSTYTHNCQFINYPDKCPKCISTF